MPGRFDRAIIVGDACLDITVPLAGILNEGNAGAPSGGFELVPTVTGGGTSANTAVALSKLGVQTAFMGTLGEDYGSRFLLEEFGSLGIDTRLTLTAPDRNTVYVFALIDPSGERHLWAFPRSNVSYANYDLSDAGLGLIKTASWLHASGMTYMYDGTMRERLPEIFRLAKAAGIPTSFDLNTRVREPEALEPGLREAVMKTIPHVDYLLGSARDEFYSLCPADDWKDSARSFAKDGRTVIARLGGDGCYTVSGEGEVWQRPFDVPVRNTTGAGDAFNAGFIAGMLRYGSLKEAVDMGNAVASYKVAGSSARDTPTTEQLTGFLRAHGG